MKKLVFTALAVVAFSGVTRTNTAVKSEINMLSLKIKDCASETIDKMDCLDPDNELSSVQANTIYQVLYDNCVGK